MGQIFDRAIRLYRRNFLQFVGIISIAQILSTVTGTLFSLLPVMTPASAPDTFLMGVILSFILSIPSVILLQIATAALTRAVSDNYLGQPIHIVSAYRKIGRSWLTLIGTLIVFGLLAILTVLLFIIPCFGWVAAIPGLGGLVYFSWVVVPLIAPVVVLEKWGGRKAITRAWNLARRRFWWILGFIVLLSIFAQIAVSGPTFVVNFLAVMLMGEGNLSFTAGTIIQQATTFIFSVIYYPLQLTCITLLYFDLRVRTEGFDLALLAAATGASQEDADNLTARVTDSPGEFAITITEVGYFALISVAFVLLALALFVILFGLGMLGAFLTGGL
jgi:hypothetical protein